VDCGVFPTPRFRIAFRSGSAMPADVRQVATAIHAVLGRDAQPPAPVASATESRGAAAAGAELPQWAPEGSSPAALTEPLSEPTWKEHLAGGRVIERARFGAYLLIAVDPAGAARVMRYRYRLFVLPAEGEPPVLAVNHEASPFGTACFGTHRGGRHTNYGDAPAEPTYEAFRARARAILGEELLGIPAG
jgi:hypothetical protein